MTFGTRLRYLRKEKDITQEELSKLVTVSRAAIGRYENDERTPDYTTLRSFADFFNVSTDYLLGRSDIKAPAPTTAALHRTDGYDENLPPEAQKELADYVEFLKHKYGKK